MKEVDLTDPDNPEWTAEDFRRARPANEVLGEEFAAKLVRKPPSPAASVAKQSEWLSGQRLAA